MSETLLGFNQATTLSIVVIGYNDWENPQKKNLHTPVALEVNNYNGNYDGKK